MHDDLRWACTSPVGEEPVEALPLRLVEESGGTKICNAPMQSTEGYYVVGALGIDCLVYDLSLDCKNGWYADVPPVPALQRRSKSVPEPLWQ